MPKWHKKFKKGLEKMTPGAGDFLRVRMIANQLDMEKDSVWKTVDLGMSEKYLV